MKERLYNYDVDDKNHYIYIAEKHTVYEWAAYTSVKFPSTAVVYLDNAEDWESLFIELAKFKQLYRGTLCIYKYSKFIDVKRLNILCDNYNYKVELY